jgi:hypothetical protein
MYTLSPERVICVEQAMRTMTVVLTALLAIGSISAASPPKGPGGIQGMIALKLQGQEIEGTPLAWDAKVVHLLGRDGRLWSFDPNEATDYRQTATQFQPYLTSEIRAMLLRELGNGYDVSGTTHYMVAHPAGQRDRWAERFEDLYRSFVHYFSVRGFRVAEPPFPLIGIVCRNQDDFLRYTASQGGPAARGVLGYYSLESNRIILFDVGNGSEDPRSWQQNAETLIHEATHQTAFNTGIHSRYCPPPTWVVEGLATLFEARGVYDSERYTNLSDRINAARKKDYDALAAKGLQQKLPGELTASDRLFRSHPAVAYAEAWALAFYLVETQPRPFSNYLIRTTSRPAFVPYSAEERLADFTAIFGRDWPMLDAQMARFMGELK